MKVVCIDFKEQYSDSDFTLGESYTYTSEFNRLVLTNITQVRFENGSIIIDYLYKKGSKMKHRTEIELDLIDNVTIH